MTLKHITCKDLNRPHSWDKETGLKTQGKPWIGLKGQRVRTCFICGTKEYWTNDGVFCGWYSIP